VGALLRAAEAQGGFGTVLRKGDEQRGSLILFLNRRGRHFTCLERLSELGGGFRWERVGPTDSESSEQIREFLARRADLMAIDGKGGFTIVEIKVAKADLFGDGKWRDYLEYCDRFFWAVPPHLAMFLEEERYLPAEAGLIVADRYDAAVVREAAHRPLAPARRKAELLRFARRSARRLAAQIDPSLGDSN
jgi:hypothetical protein